MNKKKGRSLDVASIEKRVPLTSKLLHTRWECTEGFHEITAISLSCNGEEDKRLSIFAKVLNLEKVLGVD